MVQPQAGNTLILPGGSDTGLKNSRALQSACYSKINNILPWNLYLMESVFKERVDFSATSDFNLEM